MLNDCLEHCPRARSILRLASDVTEYMPPGKDKDNVWARHGKEIEMLCSECPDGPVEVGTKTVETYLPFHIVRRALGITATEMREVKVYDCAVRPVPGITEVQ